MCHMWTGCDQHPDRRHGSMAGQPADDCNIRTGEICGVRAAVRVEAAIQRNTGVRNYSYGKKYDQICGHADGSACGKKRSGQGNSDRAGGKKRTGVAGYSTGYTKRYGGGTGIICLRRG